MCNCFQKGRKYEMNNVFDYCDRWGAGAESQPVGPDAARKPVGSNYSEVLINLRAFYV